MHDLFMAGISLPIALYLRTGESFHFYASEYLLTGTLTFVLIAAAIFRFSRMYRGIWAYASIHDLMAITRAVTLVVVIFVPVLFVLTRLEFFPRSVPVIQWFVLIALLGGPRFVYRIWKDRRLEKIMDRGSVARIPVILVGAGDETELFLRELKRDRKANYSVLGIYDDRNRRVGREIHRVEVLGNLEDLETDLASKKFSPKAQRLVVTREDAEGALVRDVMDLATRHGLMVSRLPRLKELEAAGEAADKPIETRPIAIEDLLGRPQTPLDRASIEKMVRGRRVLVTGAGGTIGSELVRQICSLEPDHISLLDSSEYQLYEIDREILEDHPDLSRSPILADIRDPVRILDVMTTEQPEVVFHAAALKHVPMVEGNPTEGILTNIIGSRIVADACLASNVHCMVQISTDKAVNPTNVMGATKRLAEAYIQSLDAEGGNTRFVVVRFGNVLGSTGSVVPLFQRQLARGGPLTVTHPEMTRYFMTVREAVELVLQAATIALDNASDTRGKIFVLDMGEPVRILDLANRMIRLSGKEPGEDIAVEFTGLRPGEKLFEELLHDEEEAIGGDNSGLTLASPRNGSLETLRAGLATLSDLSRQRDRAGAFDLLCSFVPEYKPDTRISAQMAKFGQSGGSNAEISTEKPDPESGPT